MLCNVTFQLFWKKEMLDINLRKFLQRWGSRAHGSNSMFQTAVLYQAVGKYELLKHSIYAIKNTHNYHSSILILVKSDKNTICAFRYEDSK